jgi:organic hydroperoxide reductase OsmC/OhrA
MKTNKADHIPFDVTSHWVTEKTGLIYSEDGGTPFHIEPPQVFGGKPRQWTPEHLLLGAISSCFITTYLAFMEKFHFDADDMRCEVKGEIGISEGRYAFLKIDAFPEIEIRNEESLDKAQQALEKSIKYCLVTQALKIPVTYHSKISINQSEPRTIHMELKKEVTG